MPQTETHLRLFTRTLWTLAAFLLGFATVLVIVSRHYLIPAIDAASEADPAGRRQLAAVSALMLAVLLAMIVIGLMLAFRVRRFFQTGNRSKSEPTKYVDAWKESANRVQ